MIVRRGGKPSTLKVLERMELNGFKLVGPIFKDTLAYVQIQRMKKELHSSEKTEAEA